MELRVIDQWDDFIKLEADWNRLFQENNSNNPFVHFEWISQWWRFFGAGLQFHLIIFTSEQRIVGVAPLLIEREGAQDVIKFIGGIQANYMDLLLDGTYRETCLKQLVHYLRNSEQWQRIDLAGLREDYPIYGALQKLLEKENIPFFITKTDSYYIDLTEKTDAEYVKDRSRKHNSIGNIMRNAKKLNLLGQITYRVLNEDEFEKLFPLHDKRWEKRLDTSEFSAPVSRQFFKQLTASNNGDFKAHITALYLDERLVAYEYGLRCKGRHLLYRVTHDDDFRVYGPGKMVIREVIRACFAEGLKIYDFGSGFERYKAEWTDQKTYLNRIVFPVAARRAQKAYEKCRLIETTLHPLKHNPTLVHIKRDKLGEVRYGVNYFRNQFLPQKGWGGTVRYVAAQLKNWVFDQQVYQVAKWPIEGQNVVKDPFALRPAKFSDLSMIAELMKVEPAEIIRRFYHNDQFLMLYTAGQFRCGGWISFGWLNITEWQYRMPLAKGDVALYEYYPALEAGETSVQADFQNFMRNLFHYLHVQKQVQLYQAVNTTRNSRSNAPKGEDFQAEMWVNRYICLGGVKYEIVSRSKSGTNQPALLEASETKKG